MRSISATRAAGMLRSSRLSSTATGACMPNDPACGERQVACARPLHASTARRSRGLYMARAAREQRRVCERAARAGSESAQVRDREDFDRGDRAARHSRGLPAELPDRNTVWTSGSGLKRAVEIELKASVQNQIVVRHAGDVDLVITLGVHFAEAVFIQKVVADDQTPFVRRERNVVRTGSRSEIEHLQHARLLGIGNVEHYHLAGLIHGSEETTAVARHAHELRPAALCD